jgi:hypothetical protein
MHKIVDRRHRNYHSWKEICGDCGSVSQSGFHLKDNKIEIWNMKKNAETGQRRRYYKYDFIKRKGVK